MRFMMLVIPKGNENAEARTVPDDPAAIEKMMTYNPEGVQGRIGDFEIGDHRGEEG